MRHLSFSWRAKENRFEETACRSRYWYLWKKNYSGSNYFLARIVLFHPLSPFSPPAHNILYNSSTRVCRANVRILRTDCLNAPSNRGLRCIRNLINFQRIASRWKIPRNRRSIRRVRRFDLTRLNLRMPSFAHAKDLRRIYVELTRGARRGPDITFRSVI